MKIRGELFWVDRWMSSSAFLLPMEPRGLYREMLSQGFIRGAQLPTDEEAIRRVVAATPEEWARCWPFVRLYWREQNGVLINDTQLEIYQATVGVSDQRSAAGLKGNLVRWSRK